jgi:hypothetical protein
MSSSGESYLASSPPFPFSLPDDMVVVICDFLTLKCIHSVFSTSKSSHSTLIEPNSVIVKALFCRRLKVIVADYPLAETLVRIVGGNNSNNSKLINSIEKPFYAIVAASKFGHMLGLWQWPEAVRGGILQILVNEGESRIEARLHEPNIELRLWNVAEHHSIPLEGCVAFKVDTIFRSQLLLANSDSFIPIQPRFKIEFLPKAESSRGEASFRRREGDNPLQPSSPSLPPIQQSLDETTTTVEDALDNTSTPFIKANKLDKRSHLYEPFCLPSLSPTLHILLPIHRRFDQQQKQKHAMVCDRIGHYKSVSSSSTVSTTFLQVEGFEPGLYCGDYGPHGTEVIDVRLVERSSTNDNDDDDDDDDELFDDEQSTSSLGLAGLKVTGDPNVPATRLTFITSGPFIPTNDHDNNNSRTRFACSCDVNMRCACPTAQECTNIDVHGEFEIQCKTALAGYRNPKMSNGRLIMFSKKRGRATTSTGEGKEEEGNTRVKLLMVFMGELRTSIQFRPYEL